MRRSSRGAMRNRASSRWRTGSQRWSGPCHHQVRPVSWLQLSLWLPFKPIFLVLVPSGAESDKGLLGRLESLDHSFAFPLSALAVQLSTARSGLSYCPETRAFLQANWPIRPEGEPGCDVRYQVFRDLRGRGFYLTSAGKFGGDFLVYPGQCRG